MLWLFSRVRNHFLVVLLMLVLTPAGQSLAQGTDQMFPDPMGFEQTTELLAPLDLSEQQRQFVRAEHRTYLDTFRQLRETEISSYLNDIGSMSLEHMNDRDKIVEGTKRIRAILDRIEQLDKSFFARIRPTLSETQAQQLQRLADRRARQRLSSRHGSWDWSIPSLSNLDIVRILAVCDLTDEQQAQIDAALLAYEQSLTPIFGRVHANRLDLPLAHHEKTAEARAVFERRMAELESQLAADEQGRQGAEHELTRLISEADYWQPATSNVDLDEAKAIRADITRISRMNRQLLGEFAATLNTATMRQIDRMYERRAFGMLRIPSDPLRRRVARKLADEGLEEELRTAIEALYATYTTDRRPLVHQLVAHAEDAEFLGTSRMWMRPGAEEKSDNPIEEDRDQIRDLNERTMQAYAALTGEEIPESDSRRATFADGPVIIENIDGGSATIEIDASAMSDGATAVTGVFVALPDDASAARELPVADNLMVFAGDVAWEGAGGDFTVSVAPPTPELHIAGGVRVPSSWLPAAITRSAIRDAALAAGVSEPQLPIIDAMHDEYQQAFAGLDEGMLSQVKERLSALSRPRGGDEVTDSDIDSAFASVRSGMDAITSIDHSLFANLAIIAGLEEEDHVIERLRRDRSRFAYRHLGRGAGARMFMGSGIESQEHDVDIEQIVLAVNDEAGNDPAMRSLLDDYSVAALAFMQSRWQSQLHQAAQQAKRMQKMTRAVAGGDGEYALTVLEPMVAGDERDSDTPATDYQTSLRELNRSGLEDATKLLDENTAHEVRDIFKRQSFPAAYRDRQGLHAMFDKLSDLELDDATRRRVQDLRLEYSGEYDIISDRMIEIIRRFTDANAGHGMSLMMQVNPEYFENMQKSQQEIEVERFARRSLNQSTRQALRDMLDQSVREAIGIRDAD